MLDDRVEGADVSVVLLNTSLKPLIIPFVKSNNFTVASSSAIAAVVELAPLVIPVKVVVEPIPVYVICSVPIIKVPEVGKPAVVSTVSEPPVAGEEEVMLDSLMSVLGCLTSLFK